MGLYDDRMEDLNDAAVVAGRRPRAHRGERPYPRKPSSRSSSPAPPPFASAKAARKSMEIQSLLFSRDGGWTTAKAKKWAKDNGYKYGKVDVTEQYIRIRQFDPKGLKVKRTITLGRGIRAVVAREETMAGTAQAARRRPRKKSSTRRKTRRKTRAAASTRSSTVKARRKPAKRKKKKAPARRRKRRTRAAAASTTAAAPRRRKRARASTKAAAPRRRRRSARAAASTVAAPKRRRRRSAPRRRARARTSYAKARRGSGNMTMGELAVGVVSAGIGFVIADGLDRFLATYNPAETDPEKMPKDKFTSDGAGTLANTLNVASPPGLVRMGASVGLTAVPAVASMYVGKGFVKTGLQGLALGSGIKLFSTLWNNVLMPMLKGKDTSAAALQKSYIARLYPAEVAASINRETKQTAVSSAGGAGALSGAQPQAGVAQPAPQAGVAQPPDVGPFALAANEAYPTAAQALRDSSGVSAGATPGDNFPTVQNVWGTGQDFPTASQAMTDETGIIGEALGQVLPADMMKKAMTSLSRGLKSKGVTLKCVQTGGALRDAPGVSDAGVAEGNPGQPGLSQPTDVAPSGTRREAWEPGPPPLPGPGPQPSQDDPACACMGDGEQFATFLGDELPDEPLFSTGSAT